jgi:hypothetical protein
MSDMGSIYMESITAKRNSVGQGKSKRALQKKCHVYKMTPRFWVILYPCFRRVLTCKLEST